MGKGKYLIAQSKPTKVSYEHLIKVVIVNSEFFKELICRNFSFKIILLLLLFADRTKVPKNCPSPTRHNR